MKRVQVQLTTDQADALQRRSRESETPVAVLVRNAIDAWLCEDERQERVARAVGAIGGFHSGLGDIAEHHDRYLDDRPST